MRRLFAVLAFLLLLPAAGLAATFQTEAPEETRVREIAVKLRCPVCQSENILDSQSGTAREMVVMLREQLAAGHDEAEIVEYFRSRYGDYVLLSPPAAGMGAPIWAAPLLLLAAAGGAYLLLVRRSAAAAAKAAATAQRRAPLDEQGLERLEL